MASSFVSFWKEAAVSEVEEGILSSQVRRHHSIAGDFNASSYFIVSALHLARLFCTMDYSPFSFISSCNHSEKEQSCLVELRVYVASNY